VRFAALDGHEFFSQPQSCCEACSERKVKVHAEKRSKYYPEACLSFDRIRSRCPPGCRDAPAREARIIAAKRLLERVLVYSGRFFDAVVGDACIWKPRS